MTGVLFRRIAADRNRSRLAQGAGVRESVASGPGSSARELGARSELRRAGSVGALHPRISASFEGKCLCTAILLSSSGMRQVPERSRPIVLVETHEFREIN